MTPPDRAFFFMTESSSIPARLARIKHLADDYFRLQKGELIDKPEELLRIADIRGSACADHPHRACRVYISKRALKHFVEERKEAFMVNHTEEETISAIYFGIDKIPETIMDYDHLTHERRETPPKYFYVKDYSTVGRPSLRILVERKNTALEIRSVHFQTRGRKER